MIDEYSTIAAVDIGNSRIKVGLYELHELAQAAPDVLPEPERSIELTPSVDGFSRIGDWLLPREPQELGWWIGSVQRTFAAQLVEWLRHHDARWITLIASGDLPLTVSVPRPDMVGIDRLLAAVAANRLRPPDRGAIVVDLGTAITVDLVSPQGVFLGGAILPGIAMAARSLHEFTDLLPLIEMSTLAEPPPALGTGTIEAMRSGTYWGAVGGARHLINLMSTATTGDPQVYLTGGAAPAVADLIWPAAKYVQHLTLAGIALMASK